MIFYSESIRVGEYEGGERTTSRKSTRTNIFLRKSPLPPPTPRISKLEKVGGLNQFAAKIYQK